MASSSGGRKKRLVSSLDGEVLERLSMKLNPRMLLKDYQSLAGRLKYTYEYIMNFARERNPTLAFLQHWWSSKRGKEKTVTVLIEHLSEMERDDAVELLRPYEYYSSHEAAEYDESLDRPVLTINTDIIGNRNSGREHEHCQKVPVVGLTASKPDMATRSAGHHGVENVQNQRMNFGGNCKPDSSIGATSLDVDQYGRQSSEKHQEHPGRENVQIQRNSFGGNYKQDSSIGATSLDVDQYGRQSSEKHQDMAVRFSEHSGRENVQNQRMNFGTTSSNVDRYDGRQSEKHQAVAFQEPVGKLQQFSHYDPLRLGSIDSFYATPSDEEYEAPDEFYGARRDIRLLGLQRPRTLDGSSASSFDGDNVYYSRTNKVTQGFKHEKMMRHFSEPSRRYNDQYGGDFDPRYTQRDYGGLAAAEGHTLTAAADKVALVIGNQDYSHKKLQGLQYPKQDAADVAATLTQLNFKVVCLVNLTLSEMRTAMLAFCCLLGKGVYGVVYFAGHGYEDNGENYLLPVDSDLKYNREHSLRTQEILDAMQQCNTSLNLLIIDACRVSLPNRCGITVPRIKRSAQGNNIFAFSCCSQQESLEEPNCRNGMYCLHLLRRLRENKRVEHMLMDVGSDFVRTYNLDQRPCLETDCMMDFRLTDGIQPEFLPEEFVERLRRWNEAKSFPGCFSVATSHVQFAFQFQSPFSNVLRIAVTATKINQTLVTEFCLTLNSKDPLRCVEVDSQELTDNGDILVQTYEISNIQKMYKLQEPLILSVNAMFKVDGILVSYDKDLDLGWPLVSSIMCLWDKWLLGSNSKSTSV